MSAPQRKLKATSLRDSLGKTVRLLTKQGIDVQFRGHQPYVQTRGNKAVRLVLPEINDNAPDELIEALQGFLDHEVGHIFYTPFARGEKFARGNRTRHSLCNIIEDIRLEKLLPRDLPGTKENLERMYDSVMDSFFGKVALTANDPKTDKSEAFSCVMVCAMRALAGQKAFQKFMDDNNLWPHFMPLISKMPNISRRLRDLEEFEDVERLVEDVLDALKPPPPPEKDKDEKDEDAPKCTQKSDDVSIDPDADDSKDDGASDDSPDGESDESDTDDKSDKSDDDKDSDDGEGHGDGEGTDDGNPDDEEEGKSKGDKSDEDSDDEGAGTSDGEHESDEGDDGDEDGDRDGDEGDQDEQGAAGEGRDNRTLKDALASLEPKHRRALFLYKKKRQTVEQIADDLEVSEDETREMLAQARRQVRDFLNGG